MYTIVFEVLSGAHLDSVRQWIEKATRGCTVFGSGCTLSVETNDAGEVDRVHKRLLKPRGLPGGLVHAMFPMTMRGLTPISISGPSAALDQAMLDHAPGLTAGLSANPHTLRAGRAASPASIKPSQRAAR